MGRVFLKIFHSKCPIDGRLKARSSVGDERPFVRGTNAARRTPDRKSGRVRILKIFMPVVPFALFAKITVGETRHKGITGIVICNYFCNFYINFLIVLLNHWWAGSLSIFNCQYCFALYFVNA